MDNRTIYLIRHGRIELEDEQRRFIGQLDVPLNGAGEKQAQKLHRIFEHAEITAIYCSDLARSRQTARIIKAHKAIDITPLRELREISMGDWEGRTFADIAHCFPDEFKARGADIGYYRVPGGESFSDCGKRIMAAFHDILDSSAGNILIVGHAGVNRLLLCHVLGMPLANLFKIAQDYGCLNILNTGNIGTRVKLVNFTPVIEKNGKDF